jgi:hypothetical protein
VWERRLGNYNFRRYRMEASIADTKHKKLLEMKSVFVDANVTKYEDLEPEDLNKLASMLIDDKSTEVSCCDLGFGGSCSGGCSLIYGTTQGVEYEISYDDDEWVGNIEQIVIGDDLLDLPSIEREIKNCN